MFLLDLHSWQWQQLTMTGTAPSPRQGSAIALQGEAPLVQKTALESRNQSVSICS